MKSHTDPVTTKIVSQVSKGLQITLSGQVQGSGVRPAIRRLAEQYGIEGSVCNTGSGVLIDAWSTEENLYRFITRLRDSFSIERLDQKSLIGMQTVYGFNIINSRHSTVSTEIIPDIAICDDCVSEVIDENNRRYLFLLNGCAQCGPRFSVVTGVPFDRSQSSYSGFTMCSECQSEYDSHAHRRSYAQFNSCPVCGPAYYQLDDQGCQTPFSSTDLLDLIVDSIHQGKIVAVKGIGGFHLYCDATHAGAIATLRSRKHRPHKPLAVMFPDIESVESDFHISALEAKMLTGEKRPIVLLESKSNKLQQSVAPGLRRVGVMLPYTALHVLLMRVLNRPVVATSANISGMPICVDDTEACEQLFTLADAVFSHNRVIQHRMDDSVVCVNGGVVQMIRRGRSYTPLSIALPDSLRSTRTAIAYGSQLKNTFCYTRNGKAYLSAHIGDLQSVSVYESYINELTGYREVFQFTPDNLVCDMNPDFASRQCAVNHAQEHQLPLTEVQHHHAHMASCLVDNKWSSVNGPVLGAVFDGFGLGDDGTAWGGEWLLADYSGYTRVAHLEMISLFGGERAMREPWRSLLAYLLKHFDESEVLKLIESGIFGDCFAGKPLDMAIASIAKGKHMATSSMGRLFDGVAAALGICFDEQSYEGQAASELEALVDSCDGVSPYPFEIADSGDAFVMGTSGMWNDLLSDLKSGAGSDVISARFHVGLAMTSVQMFKRIADKLRCTNTVALSGGVFQNQLLLRLMVDGLEREGFQVLTHRQVPANDGGLSLGQAAVALSRVLDEGNASGLR